MNTKLLLLFLFSPVFVFSQTKITGKVIDTDTQKPVSDVIVHSSGKISITNDKGEFDFDINNQSEVVYFRHVSYDLFKIQSDSLHNNGAIYLTPSVTELGEVVIVPNNARDILLKAIHNLVSNFQKKKAKTYYLTHVEGNTTTGGEKEAYALIEANLFKVGVKEKKSLKWNLKLTQLDRINISNANDFTISGQSITGWFFIDNLKFPIATNDTANVDTAASICDIYENNDIELIIKVYPEYANKNNYGYSLWTINKKDTTLTKILRQSYSNSDVLTEKEYKGVHYSVTNNFHNIEFVKNSAELYYLYKFQHLMTYKILTEIPSEITFKTITHAVTGVSDNDIKKKKIILYPYESYLYKSKLPDSPGFWEKYLKNE
jgi:hypothetical protein